MMRNPRKREGLNKGVCDEGPGRNMEERKGGTKFDKRRKPTPSSAPGNSKNPSTRKRNFEDLSKADKKEIKRFAIRSNGVTNFFIAKIEAAIKQCEIQEASPSHETIFNYVRASVNDCWSSPEIFKTSLHEAKVARRFVNNRENFDSLNAHLACWEDKRAEIEMDDDEEDDDNKKNDDKKKRRFCNFCSKDFAVSSFRIHKPRHFMTATVFKCPAENCTQEDYQLARIHQHIKRMHTTTSDLEPLTFKVDQFRQRLDRTT